MSQRPDYSLLAPALMKKYLDFGQSVKGGSLGKALLDLIEIRASQMNGCAFCLDMHIKQAKIAGERELRLHHVAIWRESTLFDARERAALAWAELLTRLPEHGVPDGEYHAVRSQFSESEVAALTFAIVAINGWNRLNVAFATVPGSKDAAYGLTKAGLS